MFAIPTFQLFKVFECFGTGDEPELLLVDVISKELALFWSDADVFIFKKRSICSSLEDTYQKALVVLQEFGRDSNFSSLVSLFFFLIP